MDTSQALITYPGPLTVVPAAATPDPENVAQLAAILGLPEDQALQLLEASGGDLERAVALGLGESSTSYNVPQMDIKYDPTVSAATMWGLNVTLDLERKASSRTALNKKKGDLPPGIAFEDHSGAFVWLNTVLQALNGALLARPGDARAALFASAATDSPSKPADYLAELIAMLSRTQRAAVSAKRVADSLGAHSALTTNLADMVTKVLDGVDLAAIRVAFRTTVTDTKSFLDEAKNIIFSELEGGRSLSFPDLNASHVIGAGCIEDVLRKRFGASNAQPNASGEAKVTFIEDESAHPPDLLFLNLDTQFRGRLEGHLALDPFCRTLASSGVSDLASVESEIASILARLDKLKPAKQRHLKALLQHLRGVRRQDTIPALERLIGVHESIRDGGMSCLDPVVCAD